MVHSVRGRVGGLVLCLSVALLLVPATAGAADSLGDRLDAENVTRGVTRASLPVLG